MDKEWIKYWEEIENLEPDEQNKKLFDTKQLDLQSAKDYMMQFYQSIILSN